MVLDQPKKKDGLPPAAEALGNLATLPLSPPWLAKKGQCAVRQAWCTACQAQRQQHNPKQAAS